MRNIVQNYFDLYFTFKLNFMSNLAKVPIIQNPKIHEKYCTKLF